MIRPLGACLAMVLLGLMAFTIACSDSNKGATSGAVSNADALPDDFPVFEGSTFDSGGLTDSNGVSTFQGVWKTTANAETARRYFEDQFGNGPWHVVDSSENDGFIVIRVEHQGGDEPETGTVVIKEGENGTTITKTVKRGTPKDNPTPDNEDDSGAGGNDSGSTPSTGTSGLPAGYPSARVPLPSDATVETASGPSEAGDNFYQVDFSSPASVSALADYWVNTLEGTGWELTLRSGDDDNVLLNFKDGDDSVSVSAGTSSTGSSGNVTLVLGQ